MSDKVPFRMGIAGTPPPPSRPKSGGSQGPGTDKGLKNEKMIQNCRFESLIWLFWHLAPLHVPLHRLPVEDHVPGESALREAGQVVDRPLLLGGHQERAQVAAVGGRGDQGGQEPGGYHEPAKKVWVKKTPNTPLTITTL